LTLGQVLVEADKLTHASRLLLGSTNGSGGSEIWWDQCLGRVSATQNGAHVVLQWTISSCWANTPSHFDRIG
jgi:hypothetical protein